MNNRSEDFSGLFDEAPVMVWLTDAESACTFLNRRWYEFTGQTPETGLRKGWLDAVHPEDRDFSSKTFQAANDNREAFRLEYRLRRKDGEYRWAIDSAAPRFGPQGEFLGFIGTVTDIHDRKIAEDQLRISEERYRHLFESIDEGFCVIEVIFDEEGQPVDHRFLETNPSFEKQTGLVNAVGKTARELVPDLDKAWFQLYGRVALTGESMRFEDHATAMNRWFDVFAFRVDSPEQRRVALLFNEISGRKKRELNAALLTAISEDLAGSIETGEILDRVGDRLSRHLDVRSVAFVEIDDSAGMANVFYETKPDPAQLSMLGIHDLSNFMSEDFLDELRAGRTIAVGDVVTDPGMQGRAEAFEKLGIRSHIQGSYVSEGQWNFMLSVHDSEPRQWHDSEVEVVREVTALVWLRLERARAEESLRDSEQQARAFFEGSGAGAAQVGSDKRFRKVNDRLCQITGYSREELLQMTPLDLDHPDEQEADRERIRRVAEDPEFTYDVEKRYVRKGGQVIWVHVNAKVVRDADGNVLYSASIIQDITDRKRAEEALRELSRSLERRVAERTAELNEQAGRLRRLAAELGSAEQRERKRLAALLHDNLQQLLVASSMHLKNTARRLEDETARRSVEQAAGWIGEATKAARDLTRQLRPPVLYEDGLVAALHGLASEMAERHHLNVKIEERGEVKLVSDDLNALLFDSIRELLFNAAKYAEVDEAFVRVWEESGYLCAVVEDHGKGFDVEAPAEGWTDSGFGLFGIRERLIAFGGSVSIESQPRIGTRVTLKVPFDEAPAAPRSELPPSGNILQKRAPAEGIDRRIRLLVADDHAIVRQGLASMLADNERLEVVAEAANGEATIEAVEHERPDVALIDVNMPLLNGIEAAREIHRRWPETIIVGLSVQDDEATAKTMRDAGASAFLSKSGDSDRMIATILELVENQSNNLLS